MKTGEPRKRESGGAARRREGRKPSVALGKRTAGTETGADAYPTYCDYACPHADFADPSAVGACRRDVGVWCKIAGRFNAKNARCLMRR
ncbi:MAG: hypothetical protein QHI48_11795 [Bacteroidota bacterium]|nr:hypothetical protein [Bacteroidota bacterium]